LFRIVKKRKRIHLMPAVLLLFMYTVAEGSMWKKTEVNLSDWLQNTAPTGE
jgi:hypothetical protein